MKTRNGFVSNSSTSSFVVYGWIVRIGDAKSIKDELSEKQCDNTNMIGNLDIALRYADPWDEVGIGICKQGGDHENVEFDPFEMIRNFKEDIASDTLTEILGTPKFLVGCEID